MDRRKIQLSSYNLCKTNIYVLIRIPHAGKGVALNTGVTHSEADIVCFLDQDDIMNPGRLKLQYNAFVNHPLVDVVYSDYERVYDDGRLIDHFISRQADSRECLKRMARSIGTCIHADDYDEKNSFP